MAWDLPLEVVLGLVGVGIPLVVVLAHFTGGSTPHPLDEAHVRALLAIEAPESPMSTVQIADDGATALARTEDGRRWIAWAMESHPAIRQVTPGATVVESAEGIVVDLVDPGWPARTVPLSDAAARAAWLDPTPDAGAHDGAA